MALTKVSGDFIQDGSITQGHLHASHGITTADIGEGSNLYFTTARVNTAVGNLSTSDLSEGTNLYYTQARFNTAFAAKSTSDLSEGTNLYYTDARVLSYLTTNNYVTSSSTHTFTNKSGNISQWTNDSGYITDGNTNWDNSYGFITASSTDTLTNKSGNISMFTNDSGYITDGNTNWDNSYGFITASSTDTLTNKSGNISQWTNDSGYITGYTETDTLATVTARGASTSTPIVITASGSANSASLQIDNPDSNSFNHSIEAFAANLTNGESNIILVGKEGNTKNSGYIGYYWTASGSNNNFVSLGHWAADHLFRVYGDQVLSTVTFRSNVDVQSPIFYDKNDTTYYADFNNTGTSLKIAGGIQANTPNGNVIIKHTVSEANSWIFQENATNWGLFWMNEPITGTAFGRYTTVGAEFKVFRKNQL